MKKMGRMTKRNRTKCRRRAYEAGMRRSIAPELVLMPPVSPRDRGPRDLDGKRAA